MSHVGAAGIHGISAADMRHAPKVVQVAAGAVAERAATCRSACRPGGGGRSPGYPDGDHRSRVLRPSGRTSDARTVISESPSLVAFVPFGYIRGPSIVWIVGPCLGCLSLRGAKCTGHPIRRRTEPFARWSI